MNFKLIENFDDNTREYVQEYLYDAITELGSVSLSDYIQWFKDNTDDYDSEIEQALTDAYIEAVDYGTITDVDKTMITSELWSYIDSHEELLEYDHQALLQQCPQHLQHELKIVLNKLDESVNESLLEDIDHWTSPYDSAVFKYINENSHLVDDIETLYQRCSKYLKPSLVKTLDEAGVVPSLSVKRAQYLLQTYDPLVLMNVIRDKDDTFSGNSAFDALDYGVKRWDDLFSDIILNE